jgi:hypothetical protein
MSTKLQIHKVMLMPGLIIDIRVMKYFHFVIHLVNVALTCQMSHPHFSGIFPYQKGCNHVI